jgi:hypothetical protein
MHYPRETLFKRHFSPGRGIGNEFAHKEVKQKRSKEEKMNKKTIFVTMMMVMLVTMSFAQDLDSDRGRGRNARANRLHTFDNTAAVEISGEIAEVIPCECGKGRYGKGFQLTVAQGGKKFTVHLGPTAYLNANNWQFEKGQDIQVKAFPGTGNDSGKFFAVEITRAGKTLVLRNANGMPQWQRSRNGGRGGGRGN